MNQGIPAVDVFEKSRLRQFLLFVVGIKLAGIILIFDPLGLQSFDLPKTLFSHALSWALFVGLLAAFVRFGLGILPRTRLHLAVGGLVLANLVSLLFAENRYVALFGEQDRYLGFTYLLDMVVLYLAVAIGARSSRDLVSVLSSVAAATAVAFVYAVVQAIGLDPVNWLTGSRTEPFATFGHPDVFGHFLSFSFAICLGVAVISDATGKPKLVRVIAICAGLLCAAMAAVVATRGTLVGVAAALIVLGFFELVRRGRTWASLRAVGFGGLLALALVGAILLISPLGARTAQLASDTGSGRLPIFSAALRIANARPAFGYGPDSFGVAYPSYRDPPPGGGTDPQTSAHDWALQALATTGLVGLAALLWLYGVFAFALCRAALTTNRVYATPLLLGLAAYLANGLVTVGSIAVDWFPWVVLGATASIAGVTRPTRHRGLPRLFGIGLAILALVGMLAPAYALAANRDAGSARLEWVAQRSNAVSSALSATSRDPGRAVYWNWLGLAKYQVGLWRDAASAFEEASQRAPHESTYLINLALTRGQQALDGDDAQNARSEALDAARRALDVDPYTARANEIANLAFAFGDFDLTLRAAATTTAFFDPSYGHRTFLAAAQATNLVEARRTLEAALMARETSELRAALGETALRMGDRESARTNVRRALELAPDNGDALGLLRQIGP